MNFKNHYQLNSIEKYPKLTKLLKQLYLKLLFQTNVHLMYVPIISCFLNYSNSVCVCFIDQICRSCTFQKLNYALYYSVSQSGD